MFDKTLKATLLPASLIIRNFVNGDKHCNYELYLLEFVNKSSFFMEKSKNTVYVSPEKEDAGQCDCNSLYYQLDFKLIASKTALQGRSIFSSRIDTYNDGGIIITGAPKVENRSMQTTRIHAVLRGYTLEELCQLEKQTFKKQGLENDVCELLDTLRTRKNLLLFFPYSFEFATNYNLQEGIEQIRQAVQGDFENALKYRKKYCDELDTYFCFIYDEHIVFFEEKDEKFKYIDAVPLNESVIYDKLSNYAWPY